MKKIPLKTLFAIGIIALLIGTVVYFGAVTKSHTSAAIQPQAAVISPAEPVASGEKKLAYIVSDTKIPFWDIMARGVQSSAYALGYKLDIYSSENDPKKELQFAAKAIKEKVSGIVISPTTSSACATILKLSKTAGIPVVISDIGTDNGEYVSYISSDNREGAYQIGKVLTQVMIQHGWNKGKVGIVAIPQKRINGQARTEGFMKALNESGIQSTDMKQQVTFSYEETYSFSKEFIEKNRDLKAIWLQGSNQYKGALDAIKDTGHNGKITLITFDAEPEFLDLIPKGVLLGSAMQQPYLMGQKAVNTLDQYLKGQTVSKNIMLEVLAVSSDNIARKLPIIRQNVLGLEVDAKGLNE